MNNIQYINDDCFNVFKTLKDSSVDLINVDPPYGINFSSVHTPEGGWDNFSKNEFYKFNKQWLAESYRVLKDGGTMWMWCAPTKIPELIPVIEEIGFTINYDKWRSIQRQKGRGAKNKPKSVREDVFHLSKGKNYVWNNLSDLYSYQEPVTNVLNSATGKVERPVFNVNDKVYYFKMPYYLSTKEKQFHSCQKSILLQYALIMNSSKSGDLILDPFAGSFSSGISAALADRNYIGVEKDTDMYNKAMEWKSKFDVELYKSSFLRSTK